MKDNFEGLDITIFTIPHHTWSEGHCLPNSMHPIDVLTGTDAIWK